MSKEKQIGCKHITIIVFLALTVGAVMNLGHKIVEFSWPDPPVKWEVTHKYDEETEWVKVDEK
jgi:hypothetical protein